VTEMDGGEFQLVPLPGAWGDMRPRTFFNICGFLLKAATLWEEVIRGPNGHSASTLAFFAHFGGKSSQVPLHEHVTHKNEFCQSCLIVANRVIFYHLSFILYHFPPPGQSQSKPVKP